METVLTISELAKRWKCDPSSLYLMRQKGELKPVEKIPGIKFSVAYIEEFEQAGLDPLSPRVKRQLEEKIKEQKEYIKLLEEKLNKIKALI